MFSDTRACRTSSGRKGPVFIGALLFALLQLSLPAVAACPASTICAGQPASLGWLPGGSDSEAFAISQDGTVVVGYSGTGNTIGSISSFFWTASSGMENIGASLAGENQAKGVSADGSVVVGYAFFNGFVGASSAYHAMMWTRAGGAVDLALSIRDEGAFWATT